ncbi:hypothetical protein XENTR_v10008697 [Xenopus tropicalis]|nr:hypothetical protein XENTR_v10008697 [Xenopus tropicalis]
MSSCFLPKVPLRKKDPNVTGQLFLFCHMNCASSYNGLQWAKFGCVHFSEKVQRPKLYMYNCNLCCGRTLCVHYKVLLEFTTAGVYSSPVTYNNHSAATSIN